MEIKIEKDKFQEDKADNPVIVSISHNGYQWNGLRLKSIDELVQLYKAIEHYITKETYQKME